MHHDHCAPDPFPCPSTLVDEALAAFSAEHAEAVQRWASAPVGRPLRDVIDASVAASEPSRTGEVQLAMLLAEPEDTPDHPVFRQLID